MRRDTWPFAHLSSLGERCRCWLLAYRGSGVSCCILIAGALYGLLRDCDFISTPIFPAPWEDMFWTLGKSVVALLLAIMGHGVLLSLAASSAVLRRIMAGVTAILGEIPSLCLLGLFCAVLTPFWSVLVVAFFSLLMRSVHATLKAEAGIPSSFLKTARALRLGRWQTFWRLHLPFAFPELVRAVLRELPDFWLCILGGELMIALFLPPVPGLGGALLSSLMAGGNGELSACVVLILMLVPIFLVQHGLIGPLRGYGRHYAVCDQMQKSRSEDRSLSWKRRWLLGAIGTILTLFLACGFWGAPGPLGMLVVAICLIGGVWGWVGGLLLGLPTIAQKRIRKCCLVVALLPVFMAWLGLSLPIPLVAIPTLAVMGLVGWAFLRESDAAGRQFIVMGHHLRLPFWSFWKEVRIPLLCPALLQAVIVALPFFWDNVYLAALLERKTLHLRILQAHAYGVQGVLLCLMTLMAVSVRWGLCIPLQERMAHRYRI